MSIASVIRCRTSAASFVSSLSADRFTSMSYRFDRVRRPVFLRGRFFGWSEAKPRLYVVPRGRRLFGTLSDRLEILRVLDRLQKFKISDRHECHARLVVASHDKAPPARDLIGDVGEVLSKVLHGDTCRNGGYSYGSSRAKRYIGPYRSLVYKVYIVYSSGLGLDRISSRCFSFSGPPDTSQGARIGPVWEHVGISPHDGRSRSMGQGFGSRPAIMT